MAVESRSNVTRGPATRRLLGAPLVQSLIGEIMTMDVLARNGFRILGAPAWLAGDELASKVQRFRNTCRVDPSLARQRAIRTISDDHLDAEVVLQGVFRLEHPRHRFCAELFWPHVEPSDFEAIERAGDLGSTEAAQFLSTNAGSGLRGVLRAHALALALHCQAIEAEFDYREGLAGLPDGKWEKALEGWRRVLGAEEFWEYFRRRAATLDDPRLLPQDVEAAKADLPGVILGLQELLAERYAAEENYDDCARHLTLIRGSGYTADSIRSATLNAVKKVAGARLDDLQIRAKHVIAGFQDKRPRRAFDSAIGPLLREAREIHGLLSQRLGLPDDTLEHSPFDDLAEQIQKAANNSLLFSGDDRERSLLYCSTVSRQLLTLPLSGNSRRVVEQSMRDDSRILYSDCAIDPAQQPDALKCFFAEGADADPDASLIIRMHRITRREVTVDHARGSAGVRATVERLRLLVPRSTLAQQHAKGGKVRIDAIESSYSPSQRAAATALKNLEKDHRQLLAALRASCEEEVLGATRRTEADLAAAAERARPALADAQQALEKLSKAEASDLHAEQQRREQACTRARRGHEPAVRAAKANAERWRHLLRGVPGSLRIELPLLVVAIVALWLWMPGPGVMAGVLGVGVATIGGAVVRATVRASIARKTARVENSLAAELDGIGTASEQREREIRAAADARRRPVRAVIEAVDAEKARIEDRGRQATDRIRTASEKAVAKQEQAFARRSESLRAELTRTVDVKKESQKSEFPAYLAAKRRGFVDGADPSDGEMDMTDSERVEALVRLRFGR